MSLDDDRLREHAEKYVDDPRDVDSLVERVRARLSWRIEHGYKVCARCHEKKKPGEFRSNSSRRDGLHHTCRKCENA